MEFPFHWLPQMCLFTLNSFVGFCMYWGAFIRPAAMVMIINFIAALVIAHIGTTFQQSFEALMMLFGSLFFLFYGAGRISIDHLHLKKA
jgi:putative oxidoreductase